MYMQNGISRSCKSFVVCAVKRRMPRLPKLAVFRMTWKPLWTLIVLMTLKHSIQPRSAQVMLARFVMQVVRSGKESSTSPPLWCSTSNLILHSVVEKASTSKSKDVVFSTPAKSQTPGRGFLPATSIRSTQLANLASTELCATTPEKNWFDLNLIFMLCYLKLLC